MNIQNLKGMNPQTLAEAKSDLAYVMKLLEALDIMNQHFLIAGAPPEEQVKSEPFCAGMILGLRLASKCMTPLSMINNKPLKATLEFALAQIQNAHAFLQQPQIEEKPDVNPTTKEP